MGEKVNQKEWLFFIACFGLGILAEISFLHGRVGASYLLFISGFYSVMFLRYRLAFQHRRIGLLLMAAIWILSGTYLFYDNDFFHSLNLLVIPILVFSHIVLITQPNTFTWETPRFILRLVNKFLAGIQYSSTFSKRVFEQLFKNMNKQTANAIKRISLGLLIGIPLLMIITGLLMSADSIFQNAVLRIPEFILEFNFIENGFRLIFIILSSMLFFGIFQVLKKDTLSNESNNEKRKWQWDSLTVITILVLLNAVYFVFVVIQFKYFFSGQLMDGFTYAEYARRGFFELVLVLIINWTLLLSFLNRVKQESTILHLIIKCLYSLLIMASGVMLTSAFQRLSLYEKAYGFTMDRFLAHAFMIFLMVIFAYTFIKIWLERISLIHFYLIVGLIFYTVLNVMNVEQFIVDRNLDRFEQTGKIDIDYLASLSYTGVSGLISLYKKEEDIPFLEEVLTYKKASVENEYRSSWQSYNFSREKLLDEMKELDLPDMNDWGVYE